MGFVYPAAKSHIFVLVLVCVCVCVCVLMDLLVLFIVTKKYVCVLLFIMFVPLRW